MTPTEILHDIVTAEHEARAIYDEALRAQDGLEDSVKNRITDMRLEYFRKADEAIAKHEADEIRGADLAIREIDERFSQNLKSAVDFFEANRDRIAERIFDIVVGRDA